MPPYDIAGAFEAIENELIDSMMRNFKRHRAEELAEGYNWSMWQADQLESLERYRVKNRKKFNRRFALLNKKIDEMLKTARADGNASQEAEILQRIADGFKTFRKAPSAPSGEFFRLNDRKLDSLIKATHSDLRKAEHAILRRSNDVYRQAIFNAQVYANTGAGTYEKAVDMACRDFLNAGLQCVEYKNGSRHTLEEYARMAIRTANKRAYLMGEGEKRAEWGISTVVVNSRSGGCPLCAPYIGKVFIDDVYSGGEQTDGDYPLLSAAIRGGLFHPNCKDSTSTYYEGITTLKPVTEDELNDMKRIDALEQQKKHYETRAKRLARVAEFSLDSDNQRTYAARAKANEEKAAAIAEKLPKTVDYSGDSGIINTKIVNDHVVNPMSFEKYQFLKENLKKNGIIVQQAYGDDLRYLKALNAEASYGHGYILHMDRIPSASGLYEEIIHSTQAKIYGEFESSDLTELYAREISANRMLLKYAKAYGFDEIDVEDITKNLQMWEDRFKAKVGASYDDSEYYRGIQSLDRKSNID